MEVPHHIVWSILADLESHVLWMRDARSIAFIGSQRKGVGTRMEVETVVGPFHTLDVMEVTGWVEERSIDVAHTGLISGKGTLSARPDGEGTVVSWEETLRFPWWLGGRLTAWLARPVLASIWRGNLRRLERLVSFP